MSANLAKAGMLVVSLFKVHLHKPVWVLKTLVKPSAPQLTIFIESFENCREVIFREWASITFTGVFYRTSHSIIVWSSPAKNTKIKSISLDIADSSLWSDLSLIKNICKMWIYLPTQWDYCRYFWLRWK